MLLTPVQALNADAYAERWVRTVRAECLVWLLIIGRGHLEQVPRVYARHAFGPPPHPDRARQTPPPGRTVDMQCGSGWAVPACLVGWSEPGNQAKGGDTW